MRIGELSHASGVSVRMLRYYEERGLLRPVRTAAGYRSYSNTDLETVRRITILNRAGLTLKSIGSLLSCALPDGAGSPPCPAMQESIRNKVAELDQRIAQLTQSRALLRAMLG